MLTNEMMGLAALAVSWMTGLMIALDALIDVRTMRGLLAGWKTSLRQATAKSDELAVHEIEQRVKELDSDAPGLVFFDRKHTSTVKGGVVTLDGAEVKVTGAPDAQVWFDDETRAASAACTTTAQFDVMQRFAQQGAGGGLRTVKTAVKAGQTVWLAGERHGDGFVASLVSNFDPRTFARARIGASLFVIVLSTAWVALGTALALWQPAFGLVSIGGAVVLLGHFIGMTPVAMAVREKSRLPSVAYVRGTWRRDDVKQESQVSAAVPSSQA